jgi:hypothetical protein
MQKSRTRSGFFAFVTWALPLAADKADVKKPAAGLRLRLVLMQLLLELRDRFDA